MFFFFVHWSVFSVFLEFFRLAGRLQRPSASLLVHLLRAWCQDDDVICYSSFLWNTLAVTGLSFSSLDSCFSPHGEQNDLKNYNNPKNYLTYFYPCFSLDSLWESDACWELYLRQFEKYEPRGQRSDSLTSSRPAAVHTEPLNDFMLVAVVFFCGCSCCNRWMVTWVINQELQ